MKGTAVAMPPKESKKVVVDQGTIIILDIGRNVASSEETNDNSFFSNAKACTARILERQVLSQAKNFVGVILLGSNRTNNSMADQCEGAFRHIEVLEQLQSPTWKMIKGLPDEPSKHEGDWLNAVNVATDQFKQKVKEVKISRRKIITLMTNFQSPSQIDDVGVEMVLKRLKEENIQVDVIGLDVNDECHEGADINSARRLVQSSNGVTVTFDDAMKYLLFHRVRATNPTVWNVDLTIGPNIKIPVSSYKKVAKITQKNRFKKSVKDQVTSASSATEAFEKTTEFHNTENQDKVKADDVVKGYHYGQQIIPVPEHITNRPHDKCLSLYGFTDASNIKWQNLNGDGLSHVFGMNGDEKAQQAVRCLVECLHEFKLVGIVKKVYRKGTNPEMCVLMPVTDAKKNYLSMIAICFKEDIKNMAFPQTKQKKYECTEEQVNAFKDLIEAMDLTSAYDDTSDDTEAFPIGETVCPRTQYVLDCIAYRSLNPGTPLSQPRDEIMSLVNIPPAIEIRSRNALNHLKKKLDLKEVEPREKQRTKHKNIHVTGANQSDEKIDLPNEQVPINSILHIGTVDPINDFQTLLRSGKSVVDLAPDMAKVIESLAYCNFDGNYSKALNTLAYFRNECVKQDPSLYNTWLQTFKNELNTRNKTDVCSKMTKNKLGLILKEENNLSAHEVEDSHEENPLFENDTVPYNTAMSVEPEANDLFDEI